MAQPAIAIPEKIYFKIGEVCDLVGVQAHVLRYWETEFPQLSPQKNRSGQRSYRRRDVEIAFRIKELLYDEMFTIAGARKKLQADVRPEGPKLKIVHPEPAGLKENDHEPGLFDEAIDLDETSFAPQPSSRNESGELGPEKIDAIRQLTTHLMELREMLNSKREG